MPMALPMRFLKSFPEIFAFLVLPLVTIGLLSARPVGQGLAQSKEIDFVGNWNVDLEAEETHPFVGFSESFWGSAPQGFIRKDPVERRRENALRWFENSIEMDLIYFASENLDQNLGFRNSSSGPSSPLRFQTGDLAIEMTARMPFFSHYNGFISMLGFRPEESLVGTRQANGYSLGFGNTVSEVEGLSRTGFFLSRIGNERTLATRESSRWTIQGGLSHLRMTRFARLRGTDNLGLNQTFFDGDMTDPILIEQGEESYEKEGLGGFVGFEYRSVLNHSLSYSTKAHLHLLSTERETTLSNHKISSRGLLDFSSASSSTREGNALIDLSLEFFKALKDSYRFSLGFRYMDMMEGESPRLNGGSRDRFALRGIQASFQRFF